jgi:hypothetical protein
MGRRAKPTGGNLFLVLFGAVMSLCVLLPLAMLILGVWMARHELWVRDHCQKTVGTVVRQVCAEGACDKVIQFNDERGAQREVTSYAPEEVGDVITVCFMPGGEGSEVYIKGAESRGFTMAALGVFFLILVVHFLVT